MTQAKRITIHPDRLLPADPATRRLARALYEDVERARIFSPHGHVDAKMLADNDGFPDPASLLVSPDHYVTRVLHANGVSLDELGVGPAAENFDPRLAWRRFCENWFAFRGTASAYWLMAELVQIFGVDLVPSNESADTLFDLLSERLAEPGFRPQALFDRFRIDVLATTDDPADDLTAHVALTADPSFDGAVIPTFRPDAYLDPATEAWTERVLHLGALAGVDASTYSGFLDALRARRRHFIEHGATASDHGVLDAGIAPLDPADASRLHSAAFTGGLSRAEATAYRRNMLMQMARMSTEDGLVMQLHPGVLRNHHRPTSERYGSDTGHDIPTHTPYALELRPLLEELGTDPRFRIVLFTADETAFMRDIAPLAGFYPSVYIGAPWWFLDAPDSIARFRQAVTESAGFYRSAGFVDDTRAYCSIPARHDMSRRADASYIARLVIEHRLEEDEGYEVMRDLVKTIPRRVFTRTV